MYRSALTAPLFGFLLAATTLSHAASFSGSFVAVYPAEYGSSGALTIAGGGTSIHGSGVVSAGTLTLNLGVVRSSSGTLTLSEGTLAVTGNTVLSTGTIFRGFSESFGTLTISPGTLLLFANSSATDWGTGSHLSWTGTTPDGTIWVGGSQLELSSITFINPSSLTGSSFSAVQLQDPESGVTGLTLVPEPSGTMLAIAGGAVLLTGRRRSRGTALPDGTRSA